MTTEPPGANCPLGGLRVDTGLDSNNDGVLETGEIQHTAYVCAVGPADAGVSADAAPTDAGNDGPPASGGAGGTDAGAGGGNGSCASSPGTLLDVGTLPGDMGSAAVGIDDRGNVLASSGCDGCTPTHAFFWQKGAAIPLLGQDFGPVNAISMNRNGRALGTEGGGGCGFGLFPCMALWDAPSPNPGPPIAVPPAIDMVVPKFVGDNGAPFALAQVQRGCIQCVHAVTWGPNVIDLGTIDGVSATGSAASAANSLGYAVGSSGGRAVIWNAAIHDLGNLGAGGASGVDINDTSEVAGTSMTPAGPTHAFLWRAGSIQDLGTLQGGYSEAVAINGPGDVIGNSDGHAFLWRAGTMLDLGTLGGTSSTAVALNDAGQVTGNSVTAAGSSHAFLWSAGVMTDLGTLGGQTSSAKGINASGRVVGTSATASGASHAFVACPTDSATGSP